MPTKTKNRKITTFLSDGLVTEKDFLLVISAGVFFLFVVIGLVMVLFHQEISPTYLDLLDTVYPVVITIVTGLFGVNITETVVNRPHRDSNENTGNFVNVEKAENVYESPIYEEPNKYGNEDDVI